MKSHSLKFGLFVLGMLLLPSLAHAVCPAVPLGSSADRVIQMVAGPDGLVQMGPDSVVDATEEGAIVYDATNDSIAVCDGTNWVVLGDNPLRSDCGAGSELEWDGTEWQCTDPCETGPIGMRCSSDGAIYAGDTVGGARMYAAACDHGMTWDGSACTGSQSPLQVKTVGTFTTGTTSLTDGVANTDAMATAGIALHPAAEACRNVGPEWYLPARDELDNLYNLYQVDWDANGMLDDFGFDETGRYWSSSHHPSGTGRRIENQTFSDGSQADSNNTDPLLVRCVRR